MDHLNNKQLSQQIDGLSQLLSLNQKLLNSENFQSCYFITVNELKALLKSQFAIAFTRRNYFLTKKLDVAAVSDVAKIEKHSSYIRWYKKLFQCAESLFVNHAETISFGVIDRKIIADNEDISGSVKDELIGSWGKYGSETIVFLPIIVDGDYQGGVLLSKNDDFSNAEQAISQYLINTLQEKHSQLKAKASIFYRFHRVFTPSFFKIAVVLLLLASFLVPIRLSVLATANIAPKNSLILRAPLSASISQVLIEPNTWVEKGDLLLILETDTLETQLIVAKQALKIAEAEYRKSQQASLSDYREKAKLTVLQLEIKKQQAELNYINKKISDSHIRAERDGVVIFSSKNSLLGKYVQLGERLITLADPNDKEMELWLPVGDDIVLKKNYPVTLFPSVAPNKQLQGKIYTVNYHAQDYEGVLAYRIFATIDPDQELDLRVGQRGVARIYGEKVSLFYYVFRRPIAYLRQLIGF